MCPSLAPHSSPVTSECDDACLVALSADLAAALAWGVGVELRWGALLAVVSPWTPATSPTLPPREWPDPRSDVSTWPSVDVPALVDGARWVPPASAGEGITVTNGRVRGPVPGAVRLVRPGLDRRCITVELRPGGGTDLTAPEPCPVPSRQVLLTNVVGDPIAGCLVWTDPETAEVVSEAVEGPVDVPKDAFVRAVGLPTADHGDRLVAAVAPPGTPVRGTLEGRWSSPDGPVSVGGAEVRWEDGRRGRFVRVWSNGAWELDAECAWIVTSETASLRVCFGSRAQRLVRVSP